MNTTPDHFLLTNQLLIAIDLIGVFVMGIVGGSLARRLQFDAVGYAVLGVISGLGGGIIRDLILNYGIPAAFANPLYLTVGLAGSAIAYFVSSEGAMWRHTTTVLDCIALGLWAAIGTAKSMLVGLSPLPAVMLGVTTGVGGGVIRDIAVGRIPVVFGGGPLYATAALLTSVLTWLVYYFDLPAWTVLIAASCGTLLAIFAQWKQWKLPTNAPDLAVTMSPSQLRAFARRVRKAERRRVAIETGAIPVVNIDNDDLARDILENPPEVEP
ncbi:trimeric intracellular cation channel family protein [Dermabacter jinjuensis]|uniref:Glycine transporter domain-containing protein n=1 Tax=Dermabacter jinjuensis TaxID=1667168 RepID=A0ABM6PMK5_9MICO|nr:TRIC cation channel family protein [Dermabacter jinjuensis]ATH96560.1 hypothetical protein COP05_05235 [Dermabacter jinjuensis]UEB90652.1 TRIC cation channel family protein [Dermabacter jinjuensis]